MDAKEYLNQLNDIRVSVQSKVDMIGELRERAYSTSAYISDVRVQTSRNRTKMEEYICRYVDLENEMLEELDRLTDKQLEIIRVIEQLPYNEYDFLHKRFFQNMDIQSIATVNNRSLSWATYIQKRALQHVQDILDKAG